MYKEITKYCLKNPCYIDDVKLHSVEKLIVHSPAVIKASGYTQDVIISGEMWYERWNKASVEKLAHGFIDDGVVYHFLPENIAGWQVGNWYGNCRSIGYEFCEYTDKVKALRVYQTGVEYYAYMCNKYKLKVTDILGHKEAHDKWYGSNHSDPDPYFRTFGKSMKTFREDVQKILENGGKNMADFYEGLNVIQVFEYGTVRTVGIQDLPLKTAPNEDAPNNPDHPYLGKGNKIIVLFKLSNNWGCVILNSGDKIKSGFVNCQYLMK